MRIVVAGAGITGLAAAFTLQQEAARRRQDIDLVVLEAGSEAGGNARTIEDQGFLIEHGPNGFLDRSAETRALIEELSLQERLVAANPVLRRRLIFSGGVLRQVPQSPPALLTSDAIGWRGKLRMLREPWAPAPPAGKEETVFEFAERRLGREAAETFVDTAVAGISGGDSRAISVGAQFPVLKEMEDTHGSLLKGMLARRGTPRARLMSFDRGLGTLIGALATRLNSALRLNSCIERVEKTGASWRIHLASGAAIVADQFVCALPSYAAAQVAAGFDRELSRSLTSIPYAGLSMVALAYRAGAISRPLNGFGYMVTRSEGLATLGVLWESSIFPNRAPEGSVLLRVILGGTRRPDVGALDDQSIGELAERELGPVLGVSGRPVRQWVCRWPSAIAQYTVGHDTRVSEIRRLAAAHGGLQFCGTGYDGVSLNDGIASGCRAARAILAEVPA